MKWYYSLHDSGNLNFPALFHFWSCPTKTAGKFKLKSANVKKCGKFKLKFHKCQKVWEYSNSSNHVASNTISYIICALGFYWINKVNYFLYHKTLCNIRVSEWKKNVCYTTFRLYKKAFKVGSIPYTAQSAVSSGRRFSIGKVIFFNALPAKKSLWHLLEIAFIENLPLKSM